MAVELEHCLAGRGIRLEMVDVDTAPELKARFGWDVPLLFEDGVEICRHEFDTAAFETWLREV